MSEFSNLRGRAGIVGMCRSLQTGSVLVLNIVLARVMGPELFGSFQQVFIFNALFLIMTFGIPETMYYFLPRLKEEERGRFLGQTLTVLFFLSTVTALLFWFCAPLLARYQHNPDIAGQLRMFGFYGAGIIAASFADPVFITFKRVRYLFFINAAHAAFLLGITLLYVFGKTDAATIFAKMAVFGAVKCLLACVFLYKVRTLTGSVRFFGEGSSVLLQLSFALPIMLSGTIDIIARWLDKYIVSFMFGTEALGVFFVGAIEIPFIGILISSVFSVISPVLNTFHHEEDFGAFARLVNKSIRFTTKFIWPVFIYCFIFADHLLPLVFKQDFLGAVTPFRIYLMMLPLRIASYGVMVVALGRPRVVLQCAFLALAANAVLNVILAIQIGFIGPAVATVVSTYIHVAMLVTVVLADLNVRLRDLFPFPQMGRIALVSCIAGALAYGLSMYLTGDLETVVSSAIVFILVYLYAGARAGFVRFERMLDLLGGNLGGQKPRS